MVALDANLQEPLWSFYNDGEVDTILVHDGLVYIERSGRLSSRGADDGSDPQLVFGDCVEPYVVRGEVQCSTRYGWVTVTPKRLWAIDGHQILVLEDALAPEDLSAFYLSQTEIAGQVTHFSLLQ